MDTTTVEHAREIVAELQSKLVAVSDRATALAAERRRLAYDAGVGDAKAKTRLEKLTNESAVAAIDVENAHAALEEARHRLASAEAAAALAERKAEAERLHAEVKELAAKIESRGPAMAGALATFCAEYSALDSDLTALRSLGATVASKRGVALSVEAVLSHTARSVGLHLGDIVEPARRHSPEFLATGLATSARTWADAVLNERAA
jgi:hypothetical protein